MRILIVGHGRMGQLIERLAPEHGCEIAGIVTEAPGSSVRQDFGPVDVAIDFTLPEAVPDTFEALAERGLNVVIGTTGWQVHEPALRALADKRGLGVLASANFSLGMTVFRMIVEEASRRFMAAGGVGAWIHEAHHAAKLDAPSGTALMLKRAMQEAGYAPPIDVSSTRAGAIPGTHTIGFDAAAETVTLTHTVRDRAVFAHGALEAAKWLKGRRGWFGMRDMITGG